MYLTRMHLNPARRGTRFLRASPQRMHAAVLGCFPPGAALEGPAGRVLWRVDDGGPGDLKLFIASPSRPDLTSLVEQAGWPAAEQHWQTAAMSGLLAGLEKGQEWVFRLTANPVHNVRSGDGRRGKVYGHVTAVHQEEWLLSRCGKWGFEVVEGSAGAPALKLSARRQISFPRRSDGADRTVTLTVVTYDGILRVHDEERMRETLTRGVGRAKGYGCGLLTLAPRP